MAISQIQIPSGNPNIEFTATDEFGNEWQIGLQAITDGRVGCTVYKNSKLLRAGVIATTQSLLVFPIYSQDSNLIWYSSTDSKITTESIGSISNLFFITGEELKKIYGRA